MMLLTLIRKVRPAAVWAVILLAGAVAGWFGRDARRQRVTAELVSDAKRSAVAFDPAELRSLTGTRADLASPLYATVKNRLRNLRAVNPKVRFVYLFRSQPDGQVVFLGDSALPGAKDESLPGDVYPQAPNSPGLQAILRTGEPATEGPLRDDFGTWITAYATVDERPGINRGQTVKDILGLDVDAGAWERDLWLAALQSALYVGLLLGLPFGAWHVMRRQVEQREVIRNLSEAMEQSHSALMICDLESRIEYANRGLCQQIGYTRRELIGRTWREFRRADPADDGMADLLATVRAGRTWEGEWTNQRKDGTAYPVRGVITPVKHRDGTLACYVAVFDDVTEMKRREAELRDARDHAQAGDRAKSQFLATMSHEVRTPLNGIVGFTSLLLDTSLAPDQREYVQTIRASGEALIQLTSDILDFARIESGKMKLDAAPCDPRECVEDALDLLATKAAEKNIELLHRIAPDVPSTVLADGGRLRQVLTNLVGNAVKFTETGEVTVSVRVVVGAAPVAPPGTANDGECVLEFSVRDTGIGIATEQQQKLFKPFSQLDESSTRRYGGTGLGLAICRNLVRLMDGEITCSSTPGGGATFTFTARTTVIALDPPDHDLSQLRLALAAQPGAVRRELTDLISGWGAAVTEADSPGDLAGKSWDVALVDVNDSLARVLAQQTGPLPELPPAKTFGLVPISLSSELRTALRMHFRLLINKPVHHETLFSTLSGAAPRAAAIPIAAPVQFGLRVLVVEDNPVNQRLMRRVLTNLACPFAVMENGQRALEELSHRAEDYDVVLLDLHMPEMDGLTALRAIRGGKAGPVAQSIWIVALTADARDEQRARARAAGINDYLTKPLKPAELEAAFHRFRAERVASKS
jgi:PAS domain S-box-containing protein